MGFRVFLEQKAGLVVATSKWVVDVGDADFSQEVIQRSSSVPVVVDFWAPWCGPCRALGPLLEKLAEENAGVFILAKVNVDEAPQTAADFGIESIPAVKAFRDGRVVLEFVGLLPEVQLREFIEQTRPSETDRLVTQASALESENPTEAEALYRKAIDLDGSREKARVGLARLLIARNRDEEAAEMLEQLGPGGDEGPEYERLQALLSVRRTGLEFGEPAAAKKQLEADPDNAELAYRVGSALAAAGRYPEALAHLLSAAEKDQKLGASKVREMMVQIFHVVGVRSELADAYRDKLSRLLY
jgi:putative thioredoxin